MITPSLLDEAVSELAKAGHGERGAVFDHYAKTAGASRQTMIRRLRERAPWMFRERRKRSDAGATRYSVGKVREVAAIQAKRAFDALHHVDDAAAIDIAVRSGILTSHEELPVEAFRRLKRQHELTPHPAPYVRFRASKPNELHQFDFSVSEYFKLVRRTEGGEWICRVDRAARRAYKNKPEADRVRVWVAAIVDDYSSAVFSVYFPMRGENTDSAIEVLRTLWSKRPAGADVTFPLGVPEKLLTDNASWAKGQVFEELLHTANVEHVTAAVQEKTGVSRARVKGKVERFFRESWREFELRYVVEEHDAREVRGIKLKKREFLFAEICEEYERFIAGHNRRKHPQFPDVTRIEAWLRVHHAGGVETLEDLESFAFRSVERKVGGDMAVSIDKRRHEIRGAPYALIGKYVRVLLGRAGRMTAEFTDSRGTKRYAMRPLEVLPVGRFRAPRKTAYDRASEAAGRMELRGTRPTLEDCETRGNIVMLPPREKERKIADPLAVRDEILNDEEGFSIIAREIGQPISEEIFPLCARFIESKRRIDEITDFARSVRAILARAEDEKRHDDLATPKRLRKGESPGDKDA